MLVNQSIVDGDQDISGRLQRICGIPNQTVFNGLITLVTCGTCLKVYQAILLTIPFEQ